MIPFQQLMASFGWAEKAYATWDPADKGLNIALSNGNKTASHSTNTSNGVRSTIGKSSGKWYWEIFIAANPGDIYCGIATSSASLNSKLGGDAFGWAYQQNAAVFHSNSSTPYGSIYTTGDTIGIALNMDAGTLIFYKNGVQQTTAFNTGITGTMFAAWSGFGNDSVVANFGAAALTYAPPAGFNAGLYN
jgi:hypothetical protein